MTAKGLSRAKVAVLISGRGSNMAALIKACDAPDFPATIVCVISDRADATGLEIAKANGIATAHFERKDFATKSDHEAAILRALSQYEPDWICLAGFMRILSAEFVEHYPEKILNIHPSLLPKYKGLDTHARALAAGDKEHGCSVHLVTAGLDEGPVIAQTHIPIFDNDTPETLASRLIVEEHKIYPEALRQVIEAQS